MSRSYNMYVVIKDFDPDKVLEIIDAARDEWTFDDPDVCHNAEDIPDRIALCGDDRLVGGETEQEFADRFTKAIWKANGAFCTVDIRATYLDDLPHEDYCLDEDDYEEFMKEQES